MMGPGQDTRKAGQTPDSQNGPARPASQHTPAAKLVADLERKSCDGIEGYRKGYGNGLTEQGVRTREVCSWLQVPAILQELQLASSSKTEVSIRLLFPNVGDQATQAEIKKFFQSYHSKPAGQMLAELEQKLAAIQGIDSKDLLAQFNLSADNQSVLSVTDVVDLNSKSTDQQSIIATLTDAAKVAAGGMVAFVIDIPSPQATALSEGVRYLKQSGVDLTNVRVWVGTLDHGMSDKQLKQLQELTVDDFLERGKPKKSKDDDGNDESRKNSPSPPPAPSTPNGASPLNGGPDNTPPHGGAAGNGPEVGSNNSLGSPSSVAEPLSTLAVLRGLDDTEQKLLESARSAYANPEQTELLAKQEAAIRATYGLLKGRMNTLLKAEKR